MADVTGWVAEGFGPVRDAFAASFASGEEIGATFCAVHRGVVVADLRGGWRDGDRSDPLREDDLFNVWSTTKALSALAAAIAMDRSLFGLDDPVASVWPEFAAAGKQAITIGQLLSHASGLVGVEGPVSWADMYNPGAIAARLAAQAPLFAPGSASAYNANVMGIWVDALLRRTDGRTLGAFFRDEVAAPLGADVWIGLPPDQRGRRAPMAAAFTVTPGAIPEGSILHAALSCPPGDPLVCNEDGFIAAGLGSVGGSAHARGLAKIMGALAMGGETGGVRIIGREALDAARALRIEGKDRVLGVWTRWAAGFLLSNRGLYGPNPASFGHTGWGGSFACADPDAGLGMAYAMNLMSPHLSNDPRARRLIEAVHACV